MNIDVTINEKPFSAIESGETFYYEPSGTMWIKLDGKLFDTHGTYNAVALDNGVASYFSDDDEITIIPTKLVNA
jgi:hypothetical protein